VEEVADLASSEDFSLARRNLSNWAWSCSEVTCGCCKRAFRMASGSVKNTARFISHNIQRSVPMSMARGGLASETSQ